MKCQLTLALDLSLVLLAGHIGAAVAAAPTPYRQAAYESPVTAGGDDLLLIPGSGYDRGDIVVYAQSLDGPSIPPPPAAVPATQTRFAGQAAIVSDGADPYSLTIRLPALLSSDQPYALWIRNSHGEWSTAIKINDARPLWMSPAFVYSTQSPAGLARTLTIVGRNLEPLGHRAENLRLDGPETVLLRSLSTSQDIDRYVARFPLPTSLAVGRYRVSLARDGRDWTPIADQQLEVRRDPPTQPSYSVSDSRFGNCRPNDGRDDTACIVAAIDAAGRAGGGIITFSPGVWNLAGPHQPSVSQDEGILIPDGVSLRGAGAGKTVLIRRQRWVEDNGIPAFTLLGRNVLSGITFADETRYKPADWLAPYLLLGQTAPHFPKGTRYSPLLDGIVISDDRFENTFVAIGNADQPMTHLFIVRDQFSAYYSALELGGDRFNVNTGYRIDDSVISDNRFYPSSRLDLQNRTAVMASELGAGRHLVFAGNVADGASTQGLYAPADPRGWRAAFFWNMNGNHEEELIVDNTASCTGDKIGDGEAISYDNNTNTFAFVSAASVSSATSSTLTVTGKLAAWQNNRPVDVTDYYSRHWIQVLKGPGIGQIRKIINYRQDPENGTVRFNIDPAWDVSPVPGRSLVSVGREYWQVYTLGNSVDNRSPPCAKSNRSRHDAGAIALWAQTSDSVVAGNRQYDSDGILLHEAYILPAHDCPRCTAETYFQSFNRIVNNLIDGEYDWNIDCSASGIAIGFATSPDATAPLPTMGYGNVIAHNVIRHADALHGGAIAQSEDWFVGPSPHRWPLGQDLLIYHNELDQINGAAALAQCGSPHQRIGILLPDAPIAWSTALYGNVCPAVTVPIAGRGVYTRRLCEGPTAARCECAP